jgi:hypothetical protein
VLLTILFVFTTEEVSDARMEWVRSKIPIPAIIVIGLFSSSAFLLVLGDIGKILTAAGITHLLRQVRKNWGLVETAE